MKFSVKVLIEYHFLRDLMKRMRHSKLISTFLALHLLGKLGDQSHQTAVLRLREWGNIPHINPVWTGGHEFPLGLAHCSLQILLLLERFAIVAAPDLRSVGDFRAEIREEVD